LIMPVFLSSSYLTLLPLVISTTTLNTAGAPGPACADELARGPHDVSGIDQHLAFGWI
jgi:hypothetical protein